MEVVVAVLLAFGEVVDLALAHAVVCPVGVEVAQHVLTLVHTLLLHGDGDDLRGLLRLVFKHGECIERDGMGEGEVGLVGVQARTNLLLCAVQIVHDGDALLGGSQFHSGLAALLRQFVGGRLAGGEQFDGAFSDGAGQVAVLVVGNSLDHGALRQSADDVGVGGAGVGGVAAIGGVVDGRALGGGRDLHVGGHVLVDHLDGRSGHSRCNHLGCESLEDGVHVDVDETLQVAVTVHDVEVVGQEDVGVAVGVVLVDGHHVAAVGCQDVVLGKELSSSEFYASELAALGHHHLSILIEIGLHTAALTGLEERVATVGLVHGDGASKGGCCAQPPSLVEAGAHVHHGHVCHQLAQGCCSVGSGLHCAVDHHNVASLDLVNSKVGAHL